MLAPVVFAAFMVAHCAADQVHLSLSAYRALGQVDLRQNGVNMVTAESLSGPLGVAVDAAGHLYVADTGNNRVLGWLSIASLQNGEAAAVVLGQPNYQQSNFRGIGSKGLVFPASIAVDPTTSDLYVADYGDNRVLRFPKPFANPVRVEPDAVYGQPDFNTQSPNSGGITAHTMNAPLGVAFDSQGNLWVADNGNNRVLRFPVPTLNTLHPVADLVLGQPDFQSGNPDRGGAVSNTGFHSPRGLAFDAQNNLYVADALNTRVLQFAAPFTSASAATVVYGQAKFTTRGVPQVPTAVSMAGPTGVAVDGKGTLYVAVPNDNRVLVFAPKAASGAAATRVLGQPDFATVTANTGAAYPLAAAGSLFNVSGLAVDSQGDLLAADTGNSRVLVFSSGSAIASRVAGQSNFGDNSPNEIKPGSINSPYKMAIDYSHAPFALYVSDTNNHRVLVWKDAAHFHSGDPADLVIGQPGLTTAVPNADTGRMNEPSATSLYAPRGIALAADGTLYVADSGNNRVLRYARPVDQSGRITPEGVLGQADFGSSISADVSAGSLHAPAGLAIGPNGDLFVADSGNNRVLEFANGAATGATAVRVYGQPGFSTSAAPTAASAETLNAPQGLFVDAGYNLYVADTQANRVLIFPNTAAAPAAGLAASEVLGQSRLDSTSAGGGTNGLLAPTDITQDSQGNIFVSDSGNNRVVIYPALLTLLTGSRAPYLAIGQQNLQGAAPNWDTPDGLATPEGLVAPAGILMDRNDTLYVADPGNNRVVQFLKPVSVVNAATLQASVPLGQGAWCTLNGTGLSTTAQTVQNGAWPTALASRELVVNDQFKAPLMSFSPTQVNFVLPLEVPIGSQRIAARVADTGELLAGGSIIVAAYSPGFFTVNLEGNGQARALNQDNSANGPSHPAAPGSIVRLFGTGQGPVITPLKDGQPATGQDTTVAIPTSDPMTCLHKQPSVCVAVGSSWAEIQYSGLAPGSVSEWQLTIKIPSDIVTGPAVPVVAVIGGPNISNLVTLAIQ